MTQKCGSLLITIKLNSLPFNFGNKMLNLILKEQLSASGYAVNTELKTLFESRSPCFQQRCKFEIPFKQESIPVGCVPPAFVVPEWGGALWSQGGTIPRGGAL